MVPTTSTSNTVRPYLKIQSKPSLPVVKSPPQTRKEDDDPWMDDDDFDEELLIKARYEHAILCRRIINDANIA